MLFETPWANFLQIEKDEICATISADDTVTFSDPPVQFSKAEIDRVLVDAQNQAATFAGLNRDIGKSKEFLSKVRTAVCCSWPVSGFLSHDAGNQEQR